VPGAPHAGAWRTKHCILSTNYEPKSRSGRTSDQFDEKLVIVRGALKLSGSKLHGPIVVTTMAGSGRLGRQAFPNASSGAARTRTAIPKTRSHTAARGDRVDGEFTDHE